MGLLSKISKAFVALLGTLGITSCNRAIPMVMYGVPYTDFEAKCTVVDSETKERVKNVQVYPVEKYQYRDESGQMVERIKILPGESSYTANGQFVFKGKTSVANGDTTELFVKVVDLNPNEDGHYKDDVYSFKMNKRAEDPKEKKKKQVPLLLGDL